MVLSTSSFHRRGQGSTANSGRTIWIDSSAGNFQHTGEGALATESQTDGHSAPASVLARNSVIPSAGKGLRDGLEILTLLLRADYP